MCKARCRKQSNDEGGGAGGVCVGAGVDSRLWVSVLLLNVGILDIKVL